MKKRRASSAIVESLQAQVDTLSSEFLNLSSRLLSASSTTPLGETSQASTGDGDLSAIAIPANPVDCAITPSEDPYLAPLPQDGLCTDGDSHAQLALPNKTRNEPSAGLKDDKTFDPEGHLNQNVIQALFNELLLEACSSSRGSICSDEVLNQDALIRGIVHGWDTVTSLAQYCPLLEVISRLDRFIFSYSRVITRFCTLRMIHYMLMVFVFALASSVSRFELIQSHLKFLTGIVGAQELPVWYRPRYAVEYFGREEFRLTLRPFRPSQKRFPHDRAVDILPW